METNIVYKNKKIAKNSIYLFIRMIFSMSISLYTTRAILDILGVIDFGIYNVVGGVIVFFGFINQTMSTTTSRFITTALGKNDESLLHKIFCMSMNFHIAIAVLTIIIGETIGLWFVLNKLVIPIDRLDAALFLYHATVLSTCISIVNVPYNASIIAHEHMGAFAYISILQVISKLLIVLILPYIDADRLIVFSILTILISILIQIIYWQYSRRKFKENKFNIIWDKKIWKDMSGFASWNITGDLAFMCNTQGLNMLLNMFFGPVVNAARGVAIQVESVLLQFIGNFQTAINPQITKTYAAGDIEHTIYLLLKASKFCFFLMFIIAIPIYIEIEYILNFWLADVPNYTISFVKLTILMVSIDCLSRPLHIAIFATGKVRRYQIFQSSLYLTFLPLSYILLKYQNISPNLIIGILCVFKFLMLLIRVERVKSLVELSIRIYIIEVIIPSLSCLIISFIIPIMIKQIIEPSFIRLIIISLISLISSLSVIYTIGLNHGEKEFINNQIKKRLKK